MKLPDRLRVSPAARARILAAAAGRQPADLVLTGGEVLDVYTGTVRPADIGIAAGRLAWVGTAAGRDGTETLDVGGRLVVPGLIEPHCHPDVMYVPSAIVAPLISHGTTTVCADTTFLLLALDDDAIVVEVLEALGRSSLRFLWQIRCCLDGVMSMERHRLRAERLIGLLSEVPGVVGTGELTAWRRLLAGDTGYRAFVDASTEAGIRVDGHAAGASERTLGQLSAAGITSDHEAITAGEMENRLRAGMWVMLRDSSLRPDGPDLAAGVVERGLPTGRMMLTTDGPSAADVLGGHLDRVIRRVTRAGIDPIEAVRMASLNPATYLGLDAHLGGVAPGRCADLLVVDDLASFKPHMTLVDGIAFPDATPDPGFVDWSGLRQDPLGAAPLSPELIERVCRNAPAMRLEGIITRAAESPVGPLPEGWCYLALVDRRGGWVTGSALHGISTDALASTYSGPGDIILLGRDLVAMVDAYRRVVALGGAIVSPRAEVPLSVLGSYFDGRLEVLAAATADVADGVQVPGEIPLSYALLFLTLAVLPDLRVTADGVVEVKTGRVLQEPVRLETVGVGP